MVNFREELLLRDLHTGHFGMTRMKALASSFIWWPGMDGDIERLVQSCESCRENHRGPPAVIPSPWAWPTKPWSRVHIDYAGPVEGSMILVVIDAHSKWIEAVPTSSTTSSATVGVLWRLFSTHGTPDTLVSDNAACFASTEFETFVRKNGIQHVRSAPYHPASNGLGKRAVQVVKSGLKKSKTAGSLECRLARLLFRYRITPHATTGVSPSELLMGRRIQSSLDLLHPGVVERVEREQLRQVESKGGQHRTFSIGQAVYVEDFSIKRNSRWLPAIVISKEGVVMYGCRVLSNGGVCRRHSDHMRVRMTRDMTESIGFDEGDLTEMTHSTSGPDIAEGNGEYTDENEETVETSRGVEEEKETVGDLPGMSREEKETVADLPCVSQGHAPSLELRRSTRTRRRPVRLDL